jgi:hypothetical protein
MLEARDAVRALRDAAVGIDRATEGNADPLDNRVIHVAPAHDRLDQTADRVDRHGRVRPVANRVGAVDNPAIGVREHDAMSPAANLDADG